MITDCYACAGAAVPHSNTCTLSRLHAELAVVARLEADELYYDVPMQQRDEREIARLLCISRTAAYRARTMGRVDQSGDALFGAHR